MWKYIEEINWALLSKKKRGYEEGKRYMLENFTAKRGKEISEFVNDRHFELYKRIEKFEHANDTHCGNYGGDDSFGDMIHHVIGLRLPR
jgi:bisphosphoglycerate-independent phosphoglycerate mutase (AlkP superfamily)